MVTVCWSRATPRDIGFVGRGQVVSRNTGVSFTRRLLNDTVTIFGISGIGGGMRSAESRSSFLIVI